MSAYYEPGPGAGISQGQVVWIPALYPNKDNVVIDIDVASDPTEAKLSAFLCPLDQKRYHFPVKNLHLGAEEHLFVLSGKMRPAIVLLDETVRWAKAPADHLCLCIPIFHVDKPKFQQSFVLKAQAFQYPDKFYLPPEPRYGFDEGVARLELMQTVHRFAMKPYRDERNPMMLTDDFFDLLRVQVTRFLGGVLADEQRDTLNVYGELILEEAGKQGVRS